MTLMVDYSIGFGSGGGWTPAQLPSLSIWLKADRGITKNGTDVSNWADQSGNGNDASQATAADQPAYVTSDAAFGGKPVVLFDVSTHIMLATFASALTQPFTVLIVHDQDGASGGGFGMSVRTPTAGATVQCFHDDNLNQNALNAGVDLRVGSTAEPFSAQSTSLLFNNTSSQIWEAGVSSGSGSGGTNVIGTGGINIGNRDDQIRFMNGAIAELVIVDNSISTEDHNNWGNYTASEYGISWTDL